MPAAAVQWAGRALMESHGHRQGTGAEEPHNYRGWEAVQPVTPQKQAGAHTGSSLKEQTDFHQRVPLRNPAIGLAVSDPKGRGAGNGRVDTGEYPGLRAGPVRLVLPGFQAVPEPTSETGRLQDEPEGWTQTFQQLLHMHRFEGQVC